MARKALPIDLTAMQAIIDEQEKDYEGGLLDFFGLCSNIYNEKFNPEKPLYDQLLYNRMKDGLITTNIKSSRNKKLTPEHIAKMQAGRRNTDKPAPVVTDKQIQELYKLVEDINRIHQKTYELEIHGQYAQFAHAGPCITLQNFKFYLEGMKDLSTI
jgi:hypothetical protein